MLAELFKDADLERIRRTGNQLSCADGREILLPEEFGFCNGVRSAIQAVDQVLQGHSPENIWILGEIIHNPTVNQRLRQAGVRVIEDHEMSRLFQEAQSTDIVVIPAFGITRELERQLSESFPATSIIDTTCGYVRRAFLFIEKIAGQGYSIVVFGNPGHPEVRAIVSRARDTAVVYLRHVAAAREFAEHLRSGDWQGWPAEDISNPEHFNPRLLALINQTTMLGRDIDEVSSLLQRAAGAGGGEVLISNTICRATQERQAAALQLCRRNCDLYLIIGGYSSSNTMQLYRIAKEFGPSYFIKKAAALERHFITHYLPEERKEIISRDWLPASARRIGLLAGASCPAADIGDLLRKLRGFTRTDTENAEDGRVEEC